MKDGRIVEQGSHGELLALDGVFAAMWADQVAGSDDAGSSHKKELTGYLVDTAEPLPKEEADNEQPAPLVDVIDQEISIVEVETPEAIDGSLPPQEEERFVEVPSQNVAAEDVPITEAPSALPSEPAEISIEPAAVEAQSPIAFPSPEPEPELSAPVAFPSEETAPAVMFPTEAPAPVAFPSEDSPAPTATAAPVAFPASPETASQAGSEPVQTPGVTFQDTDGPSRTGTPDPDTEQKRRRTLSTQGIQRFARRISISTRRQGSSSSSIPKFAGVIPGLKREGTTSTKDDKPVKDATPGDSPSASVASDIGNKRTKKDKRKSSVN